MKPSILCCASSRRLAPRTTAFTRLELLVVLAATALVTVTVAPAVARPRPLSQSLSCLENVHQLGRAWILYSDDAAGYLPPNPDDGNMNPGRNWVGGQAGVGGAQEFNPDSLTYAPKSMLAPYLGGDAAVFRCPQDPRMGRYQGTNVALRGQIVPAARSYSMNLAVGTDPSKAGLKQPVSGAWLDGNHSHVANSIWYTFARLTDMINPGPAKTFVILDEDHRSLNDGLFGFVGPYPGRQVYKMIDWPATYHEMGANLVFADGHAEYHRWQDPRTQLKGPISGIPVQPGNVDIEWLASRATALVRQPILANAGAPTANVFTLSLKALRGGSYNLEYKDSLSDASWTALPEVRAETNGPLQLSDPTAAGARRYYRVWTP